MIGQLLLKIFGWKARLEPRRRSRAPLGFDTFEDRIVPAPAQTGGPHDDRVDHQGT